jgi:hypothetical protein
MKPIARLHKILAKLPNWWLKAPFLWFYGYSSGSGGSSSWNTFSFLSANDREHSTWCISGCRKGFGTTSFEAMGKACADHETKSCVLEKHFGGETHFAVFAVLLWWKKTPQISVNQKTAIPHEIVSVNKLFKLFYTIHSEIYCNILMTKKNSIKPCSWICI